MAKAMILGGMAIAALTGLVFTLDLALGIPFQRSSMVMDIGVLLAALMLGFASWSAFRESK